MYMYYNSTVASTVMSYVCICINTVYIYKNEFYYYYIYFILFASRMFNAGVKHEGIPWYYSILSMHIESGTVLQQY